MGTAVLNTSDGVTCFECRHPFSRTCSSTDYDESESSPPVRHTTPTEQALYLSNHAYRPLKTSRKMESLKQSLIQQDGHGNYIDEAGNLSLLIQDQLFIPFEFQTMAFGDLIWDHAVADVLETYYNAAGLFSDLRSMSNSLSLPNDRLRVRIVYNMSSKYAAESFGDYRARNLWRDILVAVDITVNDPVRSSVAFEAAVKIVKGLYDRVTEASVEEMVSKGLISIPTSGTEDNCDGECGFCLITSDWYKKVVLPGRNRIFESWVKDIRVYHEMLVRVIHHAWRFSVPERLARYEEFALHDLRDVQAGSDDLQGSVKIVGIMLDELESGVV